MPILRSVGLRYGGAVSAPAGNGPDGTRHRFKYTIPASVVDATLTDFPAYLWLGDSRIPAGFWSKVQADGGDIRITQSDGTTRCPVDLVSIDTVGEDGELHFGTGTLSAVSDNEFYIYYNAASALSQPGAATTYGRNAVWADYNFVSHDGGRTDATGNAGTITVSGAVSTATSQVGDEATDYDGVNDYVEIAGVGSISNELTKSLWVRFDSLATQRFITNAATTTAFIDYQSSAGLDVLRAEVYDGSNSYYSIRVPNADWPEAANTWFLITYTVSQSAGGAVLYVNGVSEGTAADTDSFTTNADLLLGIFRNKSSIPFDGKLDEVRTRAESLSGAWVAAEHMNQATPTTFYTIGTEQTA